MVRWDKNSWSIMGKEIMLLLLEKTQRGKGLLMPDFVVVFYQIFAGNELYFDLIEVSRKY